MTGIDYKDSVFIAYGPIGSSLSFVEVNLKNFGEHRCLCGIDYGLCELRTNVKFEGENKKRGGGHDGILLCIGAIYKE